MAFIYVVKELNRKNVNMNAELFRIIKVTVITV